jgi:hypothetical protein
MIRQARLVSTVEVSSTPWWSATGSASAGERAAAPNGGHETWSTPDCKEFLGAVPQVFTRASNAFSLYYGPRRRVRGADLEGIGPCSGVHERVRQIWRARLRKLRNAPEAKYPEFQQQLSRSAGGGGRCGLSPATASLTLQYAAYSSR